MKAAQENIEAHSAPRKRIPKRKTLVYGVLNKAGGDANLVFVPQDECRRLAGIHTAIATAKTWMSFCDQMPAKDLREVVRDLREREIDLPEKADRFDHDYLPPSYFDGDWPGFCEQGMLTWLPREICLGYGKMQGTVFNGPFLTFDLSRTNEIVQALEQAGFKCRRDSKLIRRACGYCI